MSSLKKFTSTIFYTAIFIAVILFAYDFATRHLSGLKLAQEPQKIIVENNEVFALQNTVKLHEEKIAQLQASIENINKNAANAERYSKFFLIASNIESMMKSEESADVSFNIKALQSFAVNDDQLSQIVAEMSAVQVVYGEKYFEEKFSKVVRSVMRQYYENADDHPLTSYIKSHIMPYFAYITPDGNHASYVLYRAHQKLESGDMVELYNLMLGISNESVHFKDFMEKLEKHVRVASAMEKSRKHVERMLIEA